MSTHTEPKFLTAKGKLTAYSLGCGYVEREESGRYHLTLAWETNHYLVGGYWPHHIYETFTTLGEARKAYDLLR